MGLLNYVISEFGIRDVATFDSWLENKAFRRLSEMTDNGFLIYNELNDSHDENVALHVPRVTVLYPWKDDPIPDHLFYLRRPLHIIVAPEDIRDGRHPARLYPDTATNCISLNNFLARLR